MSYEYDNTQKRLCTPTSHTHSHAMGAGLGLGQGTTLNSGPEAAGVGIGRIATSQSILKRTFETQEEIESL